MNRIMKHARKELTRLGCEIEFESERYLRFRLHNGKAWECHPGTPPAMLDSVIDRERQLRRLSTGERFGNYPVCTSAPRLEIGNYHAPSHFRERVALMRGQGLTIEELMEAVLHPEVVHQDPVTGRWVYRAGRVGVVVDKPVKDVYPLVTVLWASDELWDLNPRPEKVPA